MHSFGLEMEAIVTQKVGLSLSVLFQPFVVKVVSINCNPKIIQNDFWQLA